MSLVIPNISDELILGLILGQKTASPQQYLRLYKNDHVPTRNTTLLNLTEADASGYHEIILNQSSWNIQTISGVTSASYPDQTFTLEERASVYGYYVVSIIDTVEYLMWVERFSNAPFQFPAAGGSVAITLNIGVSG